MSDINWGLIGGSIAKPVDPLSAMAQSAQARAYQTQQDNQRAKLAADQAALARQQAAFSAAGTAWQNGDTRTAQSALIAAGANEMLGTVNASDKQAFDQHNEGMKAVGGFAQYVMQHITDPEQRAAVIRHNAPLLQAAGAHAEDIEAVASNPSDDILGGVAHQYYSPEKQDEHAVAVTNSGIAQQNATINQQNADTQRMGEIRLQQTPVAINTTDNAYLPGGVVLNGAPAGAPGVTGSAPAGTRADRNNNPGNLRWDGKSKWQGMTGVDKDNFVIFDTPANGQRALGINIGNQQKLHGINTISDFITKYAPPKDQNDTTAYIGTVARALGVGPNDHIDLTNPQVQRVLAATITGVESGGTPAKFNNAAGAGAGAVRGPRQIQTGVAKVDANAVDPNDPAVELAAQQYASTGEMPALGQGQGPLRHAILTRAAQIAADKHYTPAQIIANRGRMRASQSALAADQKMYDTIQTAEETAIMNGQRYVDLAGQMPGHTRSVTWNKIRNGIGAEFSDARVAEAKAAYTTFIGEYNRVVNSTPSGAGTMSDSSRHEAMASFENSTSPEARTRAFAVLKADMAARKQAQQNIIDHRIATMNGMGGPAASTAKPAGNAAAAPAAAVAHLRQNPGLRAAFDAKYGAGAAARALGGH